jgi:geranylgeranyl pyrophosphate synthase
MLERLSSKELCRKILEDNGGPIAEKSRVILLQDPALKDLHIPLEFVSKNWRDPLTPAMMNLACEAVEGDPKQTHEAALAMSLINLSFRVWDDIIDKTSLNSFKRTLYGTFGEGQTLMIGGLASAKAFSIFTQMQIENKRRQIIDKLLWNLLTKMAKAETINLRLRDEKKQLSVEKYRKMRLEAAYLGTCLKMGSILGCGSQDEIREVGKYGLSLGIIMELWKDFHVSLNLTLELADKIKSKALPYTLLWAMEHSEKIRKMLVNEITTENEQVHLKRIVRGILETKALDKMAEKISALSKNGSNVLTKMKKNRATQTLQLFIEAQPQLFIEGLPYLR